MSQHRPDSHPGEPPVQARALDNFASSLEQAAAATLEQCQANSTAARAALEQGVSILKSSLKKSRELLARSFALAREQSGSNLVETAERLQAELDAQRSWLLKKVRPQFEEQLSLLSPDRKPVLHLLETLTESVRQAIETFPDEGEPPEPTPEPTLAPLKQFLSRQIHHLTGLAGPPPAPRNRAGLTLPSAEKLRHNPLVTEYDELFAMLDAKVANLWSSLRFHTQIAKEELELLKAQSTDDIPPEYAVALGEAEQLALGILDAAAEQVDEQTLPLINFWGSLCNRLQQHGADLCETLTGQNAEIKGEWQEFQDILRHHRDSMRQWISSHQGEGPMTLLSISKAMMGGLQGIINKEPGHQEKLLGLTDLPSTKEIQKRAETFPLLYRRLFTLGPLKNREFMVARNEELKTLDNLFKRWEDGKPCSLAVIGPEGSGKTSLANCFASEYGVKGNLLRFEISRRLRSEQDVVDLFHQWFAIEQPTDSLDTLVQQLLARPRGMVLVEGGHNLSLRVVGGSRAAEVFFFLVLATRQHFLWLITFRRIPWTRMNYQFNVSRFFTHQIPTLLANQQEIHQALMLRQRISGYPLTFSDESAEGRENSSPEGQKNRESVFLGELFTASGGNLDAAIYYWIMCLEYNPEQKSFRNLPLGKIDFSFLRSLDGDQLFTLAEVLGHGGLSADEHSKIFHCDLLRSHLQLDFLNSLGLLLADPSISDERPNHYRLNPVYYAPVTNTLESMHILY